MNKPVAAVPMALLAALFASPAQATDLLGAYQRALHADPSILAANEALRAGREKAVQGNARLKPQLSLSASYTRVHDEAEIDLPPVFSDLIKSESSGNVHSYTTQLVQPLYDAGAYADYKQLHQQSEQAEIHFHNAGQELIQRVAQVYFDVLLAQEALAVVEAQKAAVKEQLDRAEARFEAGLNKITEVQEVQARYDAVLADEISTRNTLAIRRSQYRELTGEPAEGLAVLRADFKPAPPEPDSLDAWEARGLEGNTQVRVRQSQVEIAKAEINKYRLLGRPTLDLVASYTQKGQSGDLSPVIAADSDRMRAVGVQLSVPLYTGGRLNSRLRESVAKHEQAQQELSAARRDARLQVQDAYLAVKTGAARIEALERSLVSAQTSLEATMLGRDLGTRTTLDVLEAQQRVYTTQLDLAQARYHYLLGRVRLATAVGALKEGDLKSLNAYLAT